MNVVCRQKAKYILQWLRFKNNEFNYNKKQRRRRKRREEGYLRGVTHPLMPHKLVLVYTEDLECLEHTLFNAMNPYATDGDYIAGYDSPD